MESTLKDEFKSLISGLSTEICKEVLVEDLKDINQKLQDTSKEYRSISNEYTNLSEGMKIKLAKVQELIGLLETKIRNIETNARVVSKGLTELSKDRDSFYTEVFNSLDRSSREYSLKIHTMNEEERAIFINEFSKQLTEVFQSNTDNMQKELNIEKIVVLKNDIERYANDTGRNLQKILNQEEDFVSSLSLAICEEAKIKELKNINLELKITSDNYKAVSDTYSVLSENMNNELIKTKNLVESLEENINIINDNSNKVTEGIGIITADREAFYHEMIMCLNKSFNEYSEKIHSINQKERTTFINSFKNQLGLALEKSINKVEKAFNPTELKDLKMKLEKYSSELGIELQEIVVKEKEQQTLLLSVEEKISLMETRLDRVSKDISSNIKDISKYVDGKFNEIDNKIYTCIGSVAFFMAVLAALIIFK